ncbi:MAG: MBOAT family protein, partial [Lachnospiraceae bacterium]|nr:MBOAT family protein [Lachnospiraceae bacterium]
LVVGGFYRILWGFFLKLMIANVAARFVDFVYESYQVYVGCYVLVAGILYSIQLYADFAACISISKGVANLFGVELADNFRHPYLAVSVKDFWHRWHISLSEWLKDYIYIPLGGSRKGRVRTYINLILTFLVSGVWHGAGLRFLVWGMMHAVYQITGDLTRNIQRKAAKLLGLEESAGVTLWIRRVWTFLCVMTAWILFRAESLKKGLQMLWSMFRVRNLWIFTNDSLFTMGLEWKEWVVLGVSVLVLFAVSIKQEQGISFSELIFRQPVYVRWILYLAAIFGIMTFGVYGQGYDAQAFIYGGF